jgi:hypothetical protein
MTLLNDDQQRAIIDQLELHPQACLVSYPKLTGFWLQGRDLAQIPLVRYIEDHFQRDFQVGAYQVWSKTGRPLPPPVEAATVAPLPGAVGSNSGEPAASAAPNVILQLRLAAEVHPSAAVSRVSIIDLGNERRLGDTRDGSIRILDSDLKRTSLPLPADWMKDNPVGTLYLVPQTKWPSPQHYDYSNVLVGLWDERGNLIDSVPLAFPFTQPQR